MNNKLVVVAVLFLITLAAVTAPLGTSQTNFTVSILQVTPTSGSAPEGANVNVQGTIYTANSSYQLFFGRTLVASGKSDGHFVDANFTVPETAAGTYPLTLRDVAININSTNNQFQVSIGYNATATQSYVQESSAVTLNVAVTGGQPGINYAANVAVVVPGGTTYTATVTLGTPSLRGTASAQVTFPSTSFSPTGASTNYAGTYNVKFNGTLAQSQFTVNILDFLSYHRGETVAIHATGYQANQAATITVTGGGITIDTKSVTASADGVINTNWVVTDNTPIGSCSIKITPEGTQKAVTDQQTFTVEGYTVKVQVTNLSGASVPDVTVQAVDSTTGTSTTAESDANGAANFKLEKGPYGLTAVWNGVNVGGANVTVTGDGTFTLQCQLIDTIITVKNADGVAMPFVDLNIKYNYQSGSASKTGSSTGQTGPSGSYTLASTLAGATYTVDASIYNQIFNAYNNTFSNLSDQTSSEVTIICPSKNVTLSITGYNNEAIPDARIEFVELSNGLFYSATTDSTGVVTALPTFGMYRVRVYSANTLINETSLQVFSDTQKQIRCTLYGIQLSVSVVDLFGSPIPNVNITLNGPAKISAATQSNGIATFDNIIGGNTQIIAQTQGAQDASQTLTVNVNEPATIQVKIDKYVSVAGMLVQASNLITIIIIVTALVLFATVEIYRKRRAKSKSAATPQLKIHPLIEKSLYGFQGTIRKTRTDKHQTF